MQISDLKTYVVGNPPPHFGGLYWIFLKLTTDHGLAGYGEVYSVPFHPHVVAHYAQIAPHLYCGPIAAAADIQLSTCSPNFLIQESIQTWGGFHAQILKKPIQWQDGYIIPPTQPGLGVELNEHVALQHPYTGTRLHLEMLDRPVL